MKSFQELLEKLKRDELKEEKPVFPTIYPYYYMLPESVRENLVVKNAIRALEQTKHDMPLI